MLTAMQRAARNQAQFWKVIINTKIEPKGKKEDKNIPKNFKYIPIKCCFVLVNMVSL
jgi:hypothetical protein